MNVLLKILLYAYLYYIYLLYQAHQRYYHVYPLPTFFPHIKVTVYLSARNRKDVKLAIKFSVRVSEQLTN